MVPPPIDDELGKKALKWIKSSDDDSMYYETTKAALIMAAAGYLDEGNDLLQCLWKHKWPHSGDVWMPDQSFEVLWFAAGKRPDFVPFPQMSIDGIELTHRKSLVRDRWAVAVVMEKGSLRYETRPMPTGNLESLDGDELIRKSMFLASPKADGGPMPSAQDELEALKGLQKWIGKWEDKNDNSDRVKCDNALCVAAELAAKNGQKDATEQICKFWAGALIKTDGPFSFPCLTSSRYLARFLLQGILAESLGLTKEACQLYLKSLKSAVDARMKLGRRLVYGKWTWEKLLTTASKQAIKNEPDPFTKEQRKAKWIGRDHATDEAIKAAETRLQLQTGLPADYVEFLRASNGFPALSSTTPPLLSVENIGWLKDKVDAQIREILKEYPGDDLPQVLESSLLISEQIESDMVLLVPPGKSGGNDLWQCWFFAHWVPGEMRYPSFRHYFEAGFARMKEQTV
jgi:hypothetical protein